MRFKCVAGLSFLLSFFFFLCHDAWNRTFVSVWVCRNRRPPLMKFLVIRCCFHVGRFLFVGGFSIDFLPIICSEITFRDPLFPSLRLFAVASSISLILSAVRQKYLLRFRHKIFYCFKQNIFKSIWFSLSNSVIEKVIQNGAIRIAWKLPYFLSGSYLSRCMWMISAGYLFNLPLPKSRLIFKLRHYYIQNYDWLCWHMQNTPRSSSWQQTEYVWLVRRANPTSHVEGDEAQNRVHWILMILSNARGKLN